MKDFTLGLEGALCAISEASSIDDLKSVLLSFKEEFGVENIVYHATNLPNANADNPLIILTYDQIWVDIYIKNNYFMIDPVVIGGRRGFLPLDWHEVERENSEARWFFSQAEKHGVGRQGITMPIRGPAGERALFTFTSNTSASEWQRHRFFYMPIFQLVGNFFHDKAVILGGFRSNKELQPLSRRERECLLAIVDGKAPKQISTILGISNSAVQLYLHSARHKLMCKSITEAAVKFSLYEL